MSAPFRPGIAFVSHIFLEAREIATAAAVLGNWWRSTRRGGSVASVRLRHSHGVARTYLIKVYHRPQWRRTHARGAAYQAQEPAWLGSRAAMPARMHSSPKSKLAS